MDNYSLCLQCVYLMTCDRAKEQNNKVYFCKDFQKSEHSLKTQAAKKSHNKNQTNKNNMKNGLCRICQNRDVCKIEIPEGGLWHCENFI